MVRGEETDSALCEAEGETELAGGVGEGRKHEECGGEDGAHLVVKSRVRRVVYYRLNYVPKRKPKGSNSRRKVMNPEGNIGTKEIRREERVGVADWWC